MPPAFRSHRDPLSVTRKHVDKPPVPSLMAFEDNVKVSDDLRSVTTTIEISASPETVWKNVGAFPQIGMRIWRIEVASIALSSCILIIFKTTAEQSILKLQLC